MVLYELFCLARPQLGRAQYFDIIRSSATTILSGGGVLTDVKSFDERELAYPIFRSGTRIEEAFMWQLGFMLSPTALPQLEHGLKVDERILRYIIMKKRPFRSFPNTYRVSQFARRLLQQKPG
eukprot:jgi/Botrbrau1/9049/Bobra.0376s0025.1